jgi:hypothetical protein
MLQLCNVTDIDINIIYYGNIIDTIKYAARPATSK